jgi:hypothetical protein
VAPGPDVDLALRRGPLRAERHALLNHFFWIVRSVAAPDFSLQDLGRSASNAT